MKNQDRVELSVVVPVYRESEVIALFHRELAAVLDGTGLACEVIYVDDQSDTECLAELKRLAREDARVKVLSLSRNFGHQVALTAGLDLAAGDAVVTLDGDLQHPPRVIPELIAKWREGYEIVYTIRRDGEDTGALRRAASRLFYALMRKMSDVEIDFNCADFRLMSRKAADGFRRFPERARFIRGMVNWMGYRSVGLPFDSGMRGAGQTKYSLGKLCKFALDGILSFSVVPVRVIGLVGLLTSLVSLFYLLRIAVYVLAGNGDVPDTLPVTTLVLMVAGMQMVMLGVLGEYISRIFIESKNRPLYLVDEVFPPSGAAGGRGGE